MKANLLLLIIIVSLLGCEGEKIVSNDIVHSSYNGILSGRWLLKNYLDSIDKGCSPSQLTHLTKNYFLIDFDNSKYKTDTINNISLISHKSTRETFQVIYDSKKEHFEIMLYDDNFSYDGIEFKPTYKQLNKIGTIKLFKHLNDTLLRLTFPGENCIFKRYSNSQKTSQVDFETLVLKKLVVGNYRLLSNNKINQQIPIYFRSNGETNASNVLYKESSSTFSLSLIEDVLFFNMDDSKGSRIVKWSKRGDSLHLMKTDKVDFTLIRE